ncbi:MAG TPA: YhjD/YihY/BrkB family envelope integrity protein [Solirubrobacteraceae bacterium]|nr:YhjD/YihY/BrkB family envelope integrity protein [Solirubrobacteraceae bacterium]
MRTAARVEHVRARAEALVLRLPALAHALAAVGRDRVQGGGLLAGALAFRLFGALLPLALLLAVVLGYVNSVDRDATTETAEVTGISETVLLSVADSARLSSGTRWVVLASAVVALLWAAVWAARAIRAVHSIAWTGGVERVARPIPAALVLIGAIVAVGLLIGGTSATREQLGTAGLLIAAAATTGVIFGLWLGLEWLLPHGDAPLRALVPGAILVAVGVQVVHLGTVLFIGEKVAHASATYGSLGVAFTVLAWLYFLSRIIVAGAMLNAERWERRDPRPPHPTGTSARP